MVLKYQAEITKHQGSARIQTFFAQLCPRVVQFLPTGHSFSVQADATKNIQNRDNLLNLNVQEFDEYNETVARD